MIYIASDHAGYQLKKHVLAYMAKQMINKEITDMGPTVYNEFDDFPDFAVPLAKEVAKNKENSGILICGTGHGMCIAANKVKGINAIVGYSIIGAEMGRKHNNANILCLAARVLTPEHANVIVKKFIETDFDGDERFVRRNKKVEEIE